MSKILPSIFLNGGLEIGYHSTLATFLEPVELESGTHFLLARNGRGKTTLLRTLAGSIKPRSGSFRVQGQMQYLPEDMRFDAEITPELVFHSLLPKNRRAEALHMAKSIELDVRKPYGCLSTGNRRKTNLIVAEFSVVPSQGSVLLLDEPFSGLDAFARQAFEELWDSTGNHVLRLVSCHPDYDSMQLSSVVLIESNHVSHIQSNDQTWHHIKGLLH